MCGDWFRRAVVGTLTAACVVQEVQLPDVRRARRGKPSDPVHPGSSSLRPVYAQAPTLTLSQSFAVFGASGNSVAFPNWYALS